MRRAVTESGSWRDRTPKTGVILDWHRRIFAEILAFLKKTCPLLGSSPVSSLMKTKLDLKSLILGILLGTLIISPIAANSKPNQNESWRYQTAPNDVYKMKLKERIFQAVQERWTLAHRGISPQFKTAQA